MDDTLTLTEAQYEWSLRLVNIISPLVYEGIHSIFEESTKLCKETNEEEKYLMTFQKFLSRVPKWNDEMIQKEVDRIVSKSGCSYLEDLVTCVHVIHLKILTSIRTGKTQKKIDVEIPKLNQFIHKVYIYISRDLYSTAYLLEQNISPITFQKNRKELHDMIKKSIMDVVRDTIPVENLLRAYLDESTDLVGSIKEPVEEPKPNPFQDIEKGLSFSDNDRAVGVDKTEEIIIAPKDIPRLEEIAQARHLERKEDDDTLVLTDEPVQLEVESLDIEPKEELVLLNDIEVLT